MSRNKELLLGELLAIGQDHMATLPQTATVYEAADEIFIQGAKAVLVLDGTKRTKGLVLEQDAMQAVHEMGEDIFSTKITKIMRIDLITCAPEGSIAEGLEAVSKHQMRHLPVLSDDGDLRGFLHAETIVKSKLAEIVRKWKAKKQQEKDSRLLG